MRLLRGWHPTLDFINTKGKRRSEAAVSCIVRHPTKSDHDGNAVAGALP
jgi:hypothetical protein